ncbi:MAG: ABC transporter ATP-binding protein/permease, partial [Oscillospiraceae bacterium]|nr:ABC transporter ATP-binding protein/permease [Oscillospiraceae bacterium]
MKQLIRLLKNASAREWTAAGIALVLIIAQVWLDLKLPDYMNEIAMYLQSPQDQIRNIMISGAKMLGLTLASAATAVVVGYIAARIAASLSARIRGRVFSSVMAFGAGEMNNFSANSLITRTTNDVTQVQMIVAMGLQVIIKAPILAVWAIIKISAKNWQWTALTGGCIILLVAVIAMIMRYAIPRFKKMQSLTDNINRIVRENLSGLRVVRAYNAEKYEQERFSEANLAVTKNSLQAHLAMQFFNPTMRIVISMLMLGIYWIGAYIIQAAPLNMSVFDPALLANKESAEYLTMMGQIVLEKQQLFADMLVFSSYAMQILMAFMMLAMIFVMAPRMIVSVTRINEVLGTVPAVKTGSAVPPEDAPKGEVEFRGVSFKYPDAEDYVLHDISFTAKRGQTIAFIGSTGSGKSTLINLIPRFYDATEGQILVDGLPIREWDIKQLRARVGFVAQRAFLFSGSIAENISYGGEGDAIPELLAEAAKIAQAKEFTDELPEGFDAPVSQDGTNFSGGQRQRLSIARAVYKKPEVLIFDDSFSALDFKTDAALRRALGESLADTTKLIVAQRIG